MTHREPMIQMNLQSLQKMVMMKEFNDTPPPNHEMLTEMAYSKDGAFLLVSASEDMYLYDCNRTSFARKIESKKYGVGVSQFLSNTTCVYASTKDDDAVRHLDIPTKSYIRYYPGHTKRVHCISTFPCEYLFATASHDRTIRFWDRRTHDNTGLMCMTSVPLIALDPEGIIIAVGIRNSVIRLFDVRSYDVAPFAVFDLPPTDETWLRIEFSTCGKLIIISTNRRNVKVINAFDGSIVRTITTNSDPVYRFFPALTPDAKYMILPLSTGKIEGFSMETGKSELQLYTHRRNAAFGVAFNPSTFCMNSLGHKLLFWAPSDSFVYSQHYNHY